MEGIVALMRGVPETDSRNDDDAIDRLSYRYTTAIFIVFAVVLTGSQYVGDPIHCWAPAHFTGNHIEYTDSYCWVKNTYYLPFHEYIPKEDEDEKRHIIPYYQWVPLFLLIQALLFYLPCMVWRNLNNRSGIDVNNIVEAGEKYQKADDFEEEIEDEEERTEVKGEIEEPEGNDGVKPKKTKDSEKTVILSQITRVFDRYLKAQNNEKPGFTFSIKNCLSRICCLCCGHRQGNYLIALYLFVKCLYIVNVIGQLFLLTIFLGTEYHLYGFEVIRAMAHGEDWTESPRFPRVTMCDFQVRRLGNVQRYTVQCVLSVNLFNEKVYLFIWFWLVFLAALTCFSLITWIFRIIMTKEHHYFVKKNLKINKKLKDDNDKKIAIHFVNNYLKQDGIFVFRLIGLNTDAITLTDILCALFDKYKAETHNGEFLPNLKTKQTYV